MLGMKSCREVFIDGTNQLNSEDNAPLNSKQAAGKL